jgi:pimeloyl-ACP methyl ester carboxylesterase
VIVGDEYRITPPRESEILTKGISNSSLTIIPAAGHFSIIERPAAFNGTLRSFLDPPSRAAPWEWQEK